jgi:outer membrane protein assembly factor BamD
VTSPPARFAAPIARPLALAALVLLTAGSACNRAAKPKAVEPVDAVYRQAIQKLEKKRYYAARTLLQSLLTRIPQDDRNLLPLVQLHLGDAFYRDGGVLNLGEAMAAYRNFLTYFPEREEAAYVQFQVGMCYFGQVLAPDRDQALTLRAIAEFEKVERLYPDTPYADRAADKIRECKDLLAEHEFVIGRYYYKRKHYLASADRFRVILDKYPHYPGTEQVLYLLGASLVATANPDEARLYFQRLLREYPDGKFAREAREILDERGKG